MNRKTLKTLFSLLLAALTLTALISCVDSVQPVPTEEPSATADVKTPTVTAAEIAAEVEKTVKPQGTDKFTEVGRLTLKTSIGLKDVLQGDAALTDNYALRYTAGASFDEFGIMRFSSASDAEQGKNAAFSYIKSKAEDDLYRSYFPEEEYKLDEGEVKVYGNYVVYAILSGENRTALFRTVESLLG